MNSYENLCTTLATNMDRRIDEIEKSGAEVLNSVVAQSRLHEIINNPVTEGIDEG